MGCAHGQIKDEDTPKMVQDTFASLFSKTNNAGLQYERERARMMDAELYKAAKEGDVRRLTGIHGRNMTEEEAMNNQHGDFLNRTQHGNNNILHIAASAGSDLFVARVLERFPFLSDQVNSQGDTPLLVAARFGHLSVVKNLLEHKFRRQDEMASVVENRTNSSSSPRQLEQGTTALHEALRNGHQKVARYLLASDPQMANTLNGVGESPLYLAAESGCQLFMWDILKSELPYSAQAPNGRNVLHAARDIDDAIISELITQIPDLMRQLDKHGKAAIHYAIEADYWGLLDQMLEADVTIALFPDSDGYTPLLRACSTGCWNIFHKMLELCPESIEASNHKGQNAVHLCKIRKVMDGVKFFQIPEIENLVNVGDDEGNTPLHLAVKEDAPLKAMFLLYVGQINLWAVNKDGLTAVDIWKTDLINSNKQIILWMWLPLIRSKMQHSGHLYENKVSVQGPEMPKWKPVINTMSLVATLITTVTFAAAFTMPGGFDASPDDLGVAVLVKKAALQTFILSDTIAMCCSITVVFLLLWALILENNAVWTLATISLTLLSIALSATLVAFMSGIFAVIARKTLWVAILVCIFCSMAPYALGVTQMLNAFTILAVIPSGVLVRDMIESMKRKAMKKPREQDINVQPDIQGRSPDTSHSMINTNAEV